MKPDDDLTVAYLAGYHKRDDEVRELKKLIHDLSDRLLDVVDGMDEENRRLLDRVKKMERK